MKVTKTWSCTAIAIACALTASSLAAQSTTDEVKDKVGKTVDAAKTELFEFMEKDVLTVDFAKGSAAVTPSERSDLKALVEAAKAKGPIEKVIVASWSDKEYPAKKGETLSKADEKLATQRGDNIRKVLSELKAGNVDTHSLAEHPSWIAKTFNTRDAQLKGEGDASSLEEQLVMQYGKQLRERGGPGKAVVLVRLEGTAYTH